MALIMIFKIITLIAPIAAFVRGPGKRIVNPRLYLEDEHWDSGEVSWETIPHTQYSPTGLNINFKDTPATNTSFGEYLENPCTTPLCKKIKDDQTQLASVSAVAKISYKELFNIDIFISELNYNIHTHNLFNPSEMMFLTMLSGVVYVYNKAKETEVNRIQRLYKFSSRSEYFEKYKKIRKFTMMFFIVTTCIFTRSVQIAE